MNRKSFLQTLLGIPAMLGIAKTVKAEPRCLNYEITNGKPWDKVVGPHTYLPSEQQELLKMLRIAHSLWANEWYRKNQLYGGVPWLSPRARRSGKTFVLAQFVNERQIALGHAKKIAVISPNIETSIQFEREYSKQFPLSALPKLYLANTSCKPKVLAEEVYADEMFMIPQETLLLVPNLICGVGSVTGTEVEPSWNYVRDLYDLQNFEEARTGHARRNPYTGGTAW